MQFFQYYQFKWQSEWHGNWGNRSCCSHPTIKKGLWSKQFQIKTAACCNRETAVHCWHAGVWCVQSQTENQKCSFCRTKTATVCHGEEALLISGILASDVFTQKSKNVSSAVAVAKKQPPAATEKQGSTSGMHASEVFKQKSKNVLSTVAVTRKQPPASATTGKQGSTSGMLASDVLQHKSKSVASTVTVTKKQMPAAIGMQVCNSVTRASDVSNRTTKCVPGTLVITRKPPPAATEKRHSGTTGMLSSSVKSPDVRNNISAVVSCSRQATNSAIRNTPVSGISTPASARQSGSSPSDNRTVVMGSSLSQGGKCWYWWSQVCSVTRYFKLFFFTVSHFMCISTQAPAFVYFKRPLFQCCAILFSSIRSTSQSHLCCMSCTLCIIVSCQVEGLSDVLISYFVFKFQQIPQNAISDVVVFLQLS